jgi:hypothetical protein
MLAGPGAQYISGEVVTSKQRELVNALARVEEFANAHVAHHAMAPATTPTCFADVRNSLAVAFQVFNWSKLLIEASRWTSPVPVLQHNWTEVFRVPWLSTDEDVPVYRHLDQVVKAMP